MTHPQPETLISYTSGTLPQAIAGIVACHVSLCPQCTADIHRLALIGAVLLERVRALPQRTVPVARIAAVLADPFLAAPPDALSPAADAGTVLPLPLARYLGMTSDQIPWKRVVKGVWHYWVRMPEGEGQMRLLRVDPGKVLLEHTHLGMELTLVLKGVYGDHTGQFVRGEVIEWSEDTDHQPRAFGDEECICVIGTERTPRYKRLAARLLRPILGF